MGLLRARNSYFVSRTSLYPMPKQTVRDIDLRGKAILIRVDYNLSFKDENGQKVIADDTRVRQSLPTLQYLLEQQPKRIVLMSHLGEPKEPNDPNFSLEPIVRHLSQLLNKPVELVKDYLKPEVQGQVQAKQGGEILMLENVRFYKEETVNDPAFAKVLASLGEVFVNDAFGSSHRAHASVVGPAEFLPAVAGLLMARELEMIDKVMETPEHPFVAVMGGAKATTKIPMIEKLMTKADYLLVGGGVANTFLKALGYEVGQSLYSPESLRICQTLIWKATRVNTRLFLPSDLVVGTLASKFNGGVVAFDAIPKQLQALDIGPQTQADFAKVIGEAKTLVWNGPMGASEVAGFEKGTEVVYNAMVSNPNLISVVGGGDTLVSIQGHDHLNNITHVSTGGGAMLEYIEKGSLPGVEVLKEK